MKKIIRKVKGKKVLSFVLAAIMLATTFNIALPMLKLDASAAGITTSSGETVTQTKIVSEGTRYTTYDKYAAQYLNGASNPTNIVIPGLQDSEDYVIQGMTYYPKKDWMLITAYHGNCDKAETVKSSKVFAIDAATGEFVAMFDFYNPGTKTLNTEHGGGIAVSEHNIYYACGDDDREIAYAPLSELELAPEQTYKTIQLVASADFKEIGSVTKDDKTGYTAYVCYDQGILWTGNFYDEGVDIVGGLDFTKIASGYNAPANKDYNSMVFGYRLAGNSPTEEWNNLMGALGKDCRGIPSYVIGLSNALKDVQYAVVDNGKLYLSCSYGTGGENLSVTYAGMNPYSSLVVADIDLSQPGTKETTITTHAGDKTVYAYDIQKFTRFDMMPMSEGLCVVNDNLFVTFESASRKYRTEDAAGIMGNCDDPVDVVWQVDPYELMKTTVAAPEKSIHYEKVTSLTEIVSGEEYIIVHESQRKDPTTLKNYLYALDADGNFNDYKLSKSTTEVINGYNGMIGHPISYYSFDTADGKEILYLDNPDVDDIESIRWKITKASDGSYRFENTETYFANCNYLYFNDEKITMAPGNAKYLSEFRIQEAKTDKGVELGGFWLSNNDTYFLWCNDGTSDFYNDKINSYYSQNNMYSGISEKPGTMHCDALNLGGTNIIDGKILTGTDTGYEDGVFYIYKRVVDSEASTYESRVYTNLDSKLQANGTYTVTLDTYAISPNHYQYVGERPTDYIIVADTSQTMAIPDSKDPNAGSTGIAAYGSSNTLSVNSLSQDADTADDKGKGVVGYGFYQPGEDIYFKHTDGKYYKAYMAICNVTAMKVGKRRQFYFAYYIADDGLYYCVVNQAFEKDENGDRKGITYSEFKNRVDTAIDVYEKGGQVKYSEYSTKDNNGNRKDQVVYTGEHYRFDNITSNSTKEHQNIDAMKTTVNALVDKIAAQNPENRIALVQYGASNGYYNTSGSLATSGYTDAFWSTTKKDDLKAKISALTAERETKNNEGIMMDYVSNIISNSGENYKFGGKRNVAVIFFSDGVPGTETTSREFLIEDFKTHTFIKTTQDNATTEANQVINKAKNIKANGAFIYTVLLGNTSAGSFAKKTYMDAVSSKYPAATSMAALGGQSTDDIDYALNISTCSIDTFLNFGSIACEEVARNTAVALDNLNGGSYIRAVLDDAFIIPTNYGIKAQLVAGIYDEIGRFKFGKAENTNAITAKLDRDTKTITATGYDYSTQYISRGNPGQALRIEITGLLANGTIDNELICDVDTTALYKTKNDMDTSTNESNDLSFKKFPIERENIPEYTYVLDYGISMYDDNVNGTMLALDNGPNAQPKKADGTSIDYSRAIDSGMVEITNNSKDLLYKLEPTATSASGYVLVERDEDGRAGTYDWFKINVVPASNVYYEENEVKDPEGSTVGNIEWESVGTTNGVYRELPKEGDVYGYDEYYDNNKQHSNDSYLKVDISNKKGETTSKKKTFQFKGTGFDLVSACGANTGVLTLVVKDSDGNRVKSFMVDTYYKDADVTSSLLSQVPVVKWSTSTYDTYTVEVAALFVSGSGAVVNRSSSTVKNNLIDTGLVMNSAKPENTNDIEEILENAGLDEFITDDMELVWFDDNSVLNGGTGVEPTKKTKGLGDTNDRIELEAYIDGFRVYNPLGTDASAYANYSDSEKNVTYANVIDNLARVDTSGNAIDELFGIGYLTGLGENVTNVTFADYQKLGPKGELYLKAGSAITFKINRAEAEKVMLGLRAVNGPATAQVNNVAIKSGITSATEMYYDITNCVAVGNNVLVTVTNTGSTLLAINHIKFSGGSTKNTTTVTGGARSSTRTGDAAQVSESIFLPVTQADLVEIEEIMSGETIPATVKNGVVVPLVEEDEVVTPDDTTTPDVPEDDNTNGDTDTDNSETEDFSIFSLLELLISILEKILHNAFGTGNIA